MFESRPVDIIHTFCKLEHDTQIIVFALLWFTDIPKESAAVRFQKRTKLSGTRTAMLELGYKLRGVVTQI